MADKPKEDLHAAEILVHLGPKAKKLGPRQMIHMHTDIGKIDHPDGGEIRMLLHYAGLCMWLRFPNGDHWQIDHAPLWQAAAEAIHAYENPPAEPEAPATGSYGDLGVPGDNHFDPSKRGFQPK